MTKQPSSIMQRAQRILDPDERQQFIETETLQKLEELRKEEPNKEELSLKAKRRYATTNEVYEKYCYSCSHFLGWYPNADKKFGTVECDAKTCDKR